MATAVNSKTLTMVQAMGVATVFEILGALTLGSYNANTVRSAIITISYWDGRGGNLMFGIMCAVISSAIFNFLSNRYGWATSSTHATIGALIGIAVASGSDVTWGYTLAYKKDAAGKEYLSGQNGLGAVIASFLISPTMAGTISAIVYTGVRVLVLDRKGPASFNWALYSLPFWYAFVVAFEGWLISWKSPRACSATQGPPCMTAYTDDQIIALFFGLFGSVALVTLLFVVPFATRSVWKGWSGLQAWHLPFMVLPDATIIGLFPGIDKQQDWFDDRHLKGIDVPESETWAWTEKDMKLIRSMSASSVVVDDGLVKRSWTHPSTLSRRTPSRTPMRTLAWQRSQSPRQHPLPLLLPLRPRQRRRQRRPPSSPSWRTRPRSMTSSASSRPRCSTQPCPSATRRSWPSTFSSSSASTARSPTSALTKPRSRTSTTWRSSTMARPSPCSASYNS